MVTCREYSRCDICTNMMCALLDIVICRHESKPTVGEKNNLYVIARKPQFKNIIIIVQRKTGMNMLLVFAMITLVIVLFFSPAGMYKGCGENFRKMYNSCFFVGERSGCHSKYIHIIIIITIIMKMMLIHVHNAVN